METNQAQSRNPSNPRKIVPMRVIFVSIQTI